jgi:hypothetical protein
MSQPKLIVAVALGAVRQFADAEQRDSGRGGLTVTC